MVKTHPALEVGRRIGAALDPVLAAAAPGTLVAVVLWHPDRADGAPFFVSNGVGHHEVIEQLQRIDETPSVVTETVQTGH